MELRIAKRKNKFVYFNENGTNMGSINIFTGKFIGATLCMIVLHDHLRAYQKTSEYLSHKKTRLEKSIQGSTEKFHKDLNQLEEVEQKLKL